MPIARSGGSSCPTTAMLNGTPHAHHVAVEKSLPTRRIARSFVRAASSAAALAAIPMSGNIGSDDGRISEPGYVAIGVQTPCARPFHYHFGQYCSSGFFPETTAIALRCGGDSTRMSRERLAELNSKKGASPVQTHTLAPPTSRSRAAYECRS